MRASGTQTQTVRKKTGTEHGKSGKNWSRDTGKLYISHQMKQVKLTAVRIAYSWVILDQELSLFSDTATLLNVVGLRAPMPSQDKLWEATSSDEWIASCQEALGDMSTQGPSLRHLFTAFVEGDLSSNDTVLSPLQLRLLLHPLQTLVCQLRQFLTCLPASGRQSMGTSISKVATKARLEEISTLLRQWYAFAARHIHTQEKPCWTSVANLVMYHLICLNTRTSLPSIEQFARGEVDCASSRQLAQWLRFHCVDDSEQVLVHCGQVLRLISSMPTQLRPPWWSGAVYRIALIAWATNTANKGAQIPLDINNEVDKPFAIDAVELDDPSIEQYLKYKEGMPMLTKTDGTLIRMDVPNGVLQHCVCILEQDMSMRITEGITRKLQNLLERWKD
jgi:hypothetical protein